MKRTTSFTSFLGLALSAALGCDPGPNVPPPVGGQSGDDGGERPDPLPIPPRAPEPPCDPVQSLLGPEQATVLGTSVQGLIDNLELGRPTPLFWVPFDALAGTTFAPGPGETTLQIGIALREGQSATQVVHTPDGRAAACPLDSVSLPVHASLATADGALAEDFDAQLDFSTGKAARLVARLSPEELTGSFAFATIAAPAQAARASALAVYIDLWPGGSRGSILPQFTQTGTAAAPSPAGAPSSAPRAEPPRRDGSPTGEALPAPIVPDHWSALAVWPRREVCPNDGRAQVVVDVHEALNGISPIDVVAALGASVTWPLVSATAETPVQVTFAAPSGLLCARPGAGALEFDLQATLRASGAAAGSPLEHLDATTILSVAARAAADGAGLVELSWSRRDVVSGQARASFESATGLALAAADEYREIWWSWHGVQARSDAAAAWSSRAALAVSSLNAQQAAALASVVARGGPGPSIRVDADGFPVLPGDTLLDAELLDAELSP